MTLSVNMLAPSATANMNFVARSGNSYTSDAYGVVKTVLGQDIIDLIGDNCILLGQNGARNNFNATTVPGLTNDSTQDYAIGSRWINKTTGLEYVCSDATATAAHWSLTVGNVPPLLAGRFYTMIPGSTQASVLTVTATLYAYPVFIPNKITLAGMSLNSLTGQTGGKGRAALFYDNGAGYPAGIVAGSDSGDLAATATAVATSAALTAVLDPGIYWVGLIFTASSTMPSVAGSTAIYASSLVAQLGFDTAAHALAVSGQAPTGIAITGQTYPATNMTTSFPTFPASAALTLNATTPIVSLNF